MHLSHSLDLIAHSGKSVGHRLVSHSTGPSALRTGDPQPSSNELPTTWMALFPYPEVVEVVCVCVCKKRKWHTEP